MSLSQDSLVPRPAGTVKLTCVVSGLSMEDVKFYWWLIHDSNTPLYTFSVGAIYQGRLTFVVKSLCDILKYIRNTDILRHSTDFYAFKSV